MASYLDPILAAHRRRAAAETRSVDGEIDRARAAPAVRRFAAAIESCAGMAVIAEIKRRSPSKGDLAAELVPEVVAKSYEAGGAACLSVLTDAEFFGGSPQDLQEARSATSLPTLRKDFTVCELDVIDARTMGADAVLLIVAALDDSELASFRDLAEDLGMDALVECHDEPEVDRALAAGATLIGVNQRDLVTFSVDTERAERVARASGLAAQGIVKVAESGIRGPADAQRLVAAGYDAVLVGEHLVTSGDPMRAVRELREAAG